MKFTWKNKSNGTFYLHGDNWSAHRCKYTGKIVAGPNYALHLGQKSRYTPAMARTLKNKWPEICNSIRD